MMDSNDSAPDSWEQADIDAPEAQLNSSLARLNVNAKPFVPNVHAAEFVPSFLMKSCEAVDGLQDVGKDWGRKGHSPSVVCCGLDAILACHSAEKEWGQGSCIKARLGRFCFYVQEWNQL